MSTFINKFINILLCGILILNLGTVYFSKNYDMYVLISISIIIISLFWCILHKIKITTNILVFGIIYMLFFIPYTLISNSQSGILLFLFIYPAFFLLYGYSKNIDNVKKILNTFVNIIIIIGIISIVFWLFGSLLHIIKPTGITLSIWGNDASYLKNYYNMYFESQMNFIQIFNITINVKNCGIFAEAPMASFVYSSALLANAYLANKNKFKEYFLIILILTTQSTTGIIIVLGYIMFKIYKIKSKNKIISLFKWILIILGIIGVYFSVNILLKEKVATSSGFVRGNKFKEEFNSFLSKPLFGNGFNTHINGSSNSITSVLADGGIVLFSFYYFPYLYFLFRKEKEAQKKLILFIYISMLSITCVITSYLQTALTAALWYELLTINKQQKKKLIIS